MALCRGWSTCRSTLLLGKKTTVFLHDVLSRRLRKTTGRACCCRPRATLLDFSGSPKPLAASGIKLSTSNSAASGKTKGKPSPNPTSGFFHQIPVIQPPATPTSDASAICRHTRAFRSWFGRRQQGHSYIAWQQISFRKKIKKHHPTQPQPKHYI